MVAIALGFVALGTTTLGILALSSKVRGSTISWALLIYFCGMVIATFQLGISDNPDIDSHHVAVYRWIQDVWGFILIVSIGFAIWCTRTARAERRRIEKQEEPEGWQWW